MSSYKEAGVDIDAGNESVERIKKLVKQTYNPQVLTDIGLFGGVYSLSKVTKMKAPLLVSTIDGVGTKVKVAAELGKWDSVGQDIVNHCSNDILALGAKPLFFLDYLAANKINPDNVASIVAGMAKACKNVDCALIGGETAEMPGVYAEKGHDVVGCMIGVVDKKDLIMGVAIKKGDSLIGVASDGLHTNGYSLARRALLVEGGLSLSTYNEELKSTLGQELLRVHRSYSRVVLALMKKVGVKGIAHITGGGLIENVPRILPKGLQPEFDYSSIPKQKIFSLIQKHGAVNEEEMRRVFNLGVGLVLAVSLKDAKKAIRFLNNNGENAWLLGKVVQSPQK